MNPSTRVVADSVSPAGHRLTTFEVVMHRFVLAEFNTHRVFSRNSASSRAIPLAKQVQRVADNPAVPVKWPAEQPGMQGGDEIADVTAARERWVWARQHAALAAQMLGKMGVHKSIANRLLEPFMWHTVVVTATAWENFFGLRCNPMAQPEIRVAAEAMKAAYDASIPREIGLNEWHLPFMDDEEIDSLGSALDRVKVSSARCARVSYLTHDGVRNMEKDIQLYERLTTAEPMHASPLEHVATPEPENVHEVSVVACHAPNDIGYPRMTLTLPKYGNLLGWHQHRFDVEAWKQYRAFS